MAKSVSGPGEPKNPIEKELTGIPALQAATGTAEHIIESGGMSSSSESHQRNE
jgi:hypothetical protein